MIATGVPNPEAPSKNAPKENAISKQLQAAILGDAADGTLQ